MQKGDLLLLDIWAKISAPPGIYYDITWMGFIDKSVPEKYENRFQIIRQARDQALMFIKDKMSKNEPVYGWQVDDVCRQSISKAGYGEYFSHRTGHNIGEQVHGNGVNIDNLETKDERQILPGTCFSLEPGLYIPEQNVGFRTEIDVFIDDNKTVHVFGDIQQRIIPILTL
jgi:Xaa-Pro aminopeptidase